jgi:predicted dehydrogenase
MFTNAVAETYSRHNELVALLDANPGRIEVQAGRARRKGAEPATYAAADFDRMIRQTRPAVVIVTTPDRTHDDYIVRALRAGCDVVTEKPLTIDADRCGRILRAVRETGRRCRVTFNYRYSPPRSQIKELLRDGAIGEVLSVDFQWLLDTDHGADYFRRWHRKKANSGGLLVHKATHHFDLVNWWLSDVPETVSAEGRRAFYTPEQAGRYGLDGRGERCLDCPVGERCPYRLDIRGKETLRTLYLDHEAHDGYLRDRCVFSGDIDIEDTLHVRVRYGRGALLGYSLHSFMPWEGYRVVFNGRRGRLEHQCMESVYVSGDGRTPGELKEANTWTRVVRHGEGPERIPLRTGTGGHGGGDAPLLADLFSPDAPEDPLLRAADERAGAYSILVGVAGNRSIERGGDPVRVGDLVPDLEAPDWPPMPGAEEPVPLFTPER